MSGSDLTRVIATLEAALTAQEGPIAPRIETAIDELRAIQAEEDAPTGPVGTEVPSVD